MSCQEDDGFEPPPLVRCPCRGCDGHLLFEQFNRHGTLAFLTCSECRHACEVVVPMVRTWP